MEKTITKAVQFGLGVLDLTRDEVEKFVKEINQNKSVNTKEGRKMVENILKDAKAASQKFEKKVQAEVGKAAKRMDFATKKEMQQEIKRLEKELKAIKAKLKK